jgi:hypothetical protein
LNNRGPKGKEPSKRGGGRTRKLYQKSYIIYETADLIDHSSVSEISPEHMSSSNFDTKLNDWIPSPFPFQQKEVERKRSLAPTPPSRFLHEEKR